MILQPGVEWVLNTVAAIRQLGVICCHGLHFRQTLIECFCLKRVNIGLDHLGHADGLAGRKIAGRHRLRNLRHRFHRICGMLERRKLAAAGLVFWRRRDAVQTHAQCANVAGLRHLDDFARNILRLPFQQALHARPWAIARSARPAGLPL